jgi:hypothetical protein
VSFRPAPSIDGSRPSIHRPSVDWGRPLEPSSVGARLGKINFRKTFLAAHWDGLAAADFFTVEVLTMTGLVRYVVLFVMKIKTRTVEIAGITRQPGANWMTQVARNLTDAEDASSAACTISFWTETRSTPSPSGSGFGTVV